MCWRTECSVSQDSLTGLRMQRAGVKLQSPVAWDQDSTFGEAMLTPTTIYVRQLLQLASSVNVKVCDANFTFRG